MKVHDEIRDEERKVDEEMKNEEKEVPLYWRRYTATHDGQAESLTCECIVAIQQFGSKTPDPKTPQYSNSRGLLSSLDYPRVPFIAVLEPTKMPFATLGLGILVKFSKPLSPLPLLVAWVCWGRHAEDMLPDVPGQNNLESPNDFH
ncbi:hypothetical protein E2C01_050877 [Portunus trituberculatus]|uniref:Uncharacterized protein n=1 Tax=Portunus trituberculatus TaxID=210409 RepID=A0A5B7GA52_PORTR|nr:hypothetical protein [Portunus trituberculatus]